MSHADPSLHPGSFASPRNVLIAERGQASPASGETEAQRCSGMRSAQRAIEGVATMKDADVREIGGAVTQPAEADHNVARESPENPAPMAD